MLPPAGLYRLRLFIGSPTYLPVALPHLQSVYFKMTDMSLIVDVRDDFISLARSIHQFTSNILDKNKRYDVAQSINQLMNASRVYGHEFESLVTEALALICIPYLLYTHKRASSFATLYRRIEANPALFAEYARYMPRTAKLIIMLHRWSKEPTVVKWWRTYNKSPSVYEHTPSEAERLFQSRQRTRAKKCSETTLVVEYYRSFQRGRFRPNQQSPIPDATLYLDMDLHRGANLEFVRKYFGLESLAVITDRSEYRAVFRPGDDNRLSPLAIYDLTHQLRQPLRVFEPQASLLTKTKRKIHETVCDTSYCIYSLVKLFLGFPEQNLPYLQLSYGSNFASCYERVGKITRPARVVFGSTLSIVLGFFVMLFMSIVTSLLCTGRFAIKIPYAAASLSVHAIRRSWATTATVLGKTASFASVALGSIAQGTCNIVKDMVEGRIRQRIGEHPLLVVLPMIIWFILAEYASSK
ncbi:hypothetical protein CVT24_006248 [Panaeolus cyanescens]|uniref:Uncharacterized protein n=1 Tax=Panaeolus cyanescens TaxID=181874 RepID=A0A409YEI0_9AGAR|nr:hypothetical protein CVT24_006248 [Panaeolus cyanescens]